MSINLSSLQDWRPAKSISWQLHNKTRPNASLAIFNPDAPSVCFENALRDRQAHAYSRRFALTSLAQRPKELIKNTLAQLPWYSFTLVFDDHIGSAFII